MTKFLLCFIPIFIAVDALGVLPMFISLVEGIDQSRIKRIVMQSVYTAVIISIIFIYFGVKVLRMLNITIADFMIAGGILLFLISMNDILSVEKRHRKTDPYSLGAVPLGVPLIAGPAVLTTSLILVNEYGIFMTALSLILNILLAGLIFLSSSYLFRMLGKAGSKIMSKLAALILAAYAVSIVRRAVLMM